MTAPTPERPLDLEALRRLTPEQLASDFHHNYETRASHFDYRTRAETAVPWEQVPEQNKALMVAVVRALVFEDLNLPAILAALTELDGLRTALARCWALMDRSDGRVAEELYDILLPFQDALAAREAEEVSRG